MGTKFSKVYNSFLNKITDDMYMELTPEDTIKDLRNLLINALPNFEFPRINLYDYELEIQEIRENLVQDTDFIIGIVWDEIPEFGDIEEDSAEEISKEPPLVLIEKSHFNVILQPEEINILALLMLEGWIQRQVSSIENTRMKYSGTDFKMTSQANHLSKLLSLQTEIQRQSFHMQRLYKRRKIGRQGNYRSDWSSFQEISALYGQ